MKNIEEIKKIQRFTDLVVWREGHKLILLIYKITKSFPSDEKFGLIDQMRRASVSITSNIAEGFSKVSSKEKYKFYNTAKSSMTELQNQLIIAKDVGYLTKASFDDIAQQSIKTNKLLNGLLKATKLKKYESGI
ncbi:MAG: four helix bundle protein [Candidatus Latescibacteria bacterium]|nr:four helix bundle protein [Candidatus Latescibacterota bacterium]